MNDLIPVESTRNFRTNREALDHTLEEMVRLASLRVTDPTIRVIAIGLARSCPVNDRTCFAGRALDWIRDHLAWIPDPAFRETVQDPLFTLRAGGGDCDDLGVLFGAIAGSVGVPVAFVTGSTDPDTFEPTHVLPAVLVGGAWFPIEVSSRTFRIGEWAPGFRWEKLVPLGEAA